ncbi:M28 family peptidase [Paraperlucidibaca wandonensis]|uniref:Carboxypeptidase Q n=1 Tax=Paraperlucidibaca wandonensis TaxID=1268273 RepID=A0ABW3HEW1_9GAMM
MFKKLLLPASLILASLVGCFGGDDSSKKTSSSVSAPNVAKACDKDDSPEARGIPSENRIYAWIEDLVNVGYRRTGTPEGYAAAAYVKCQFEKIGLDDVHYEYATSWGWSADKTSLSLGDKPVDAFPSAFSFITPSEPSVFTTGANGLKAEMVDIGLGTPLEQQLKGVKGKIVLFDLKFLLPTAGLAPFMEFYWDPTLSVIDSDLSLLVANPFITTYSTVLDAAMDAGAVGFVGVLADYFDSNNYYNEFYRRSEVTIPGFWITAKEGARLRQQLKLGKQEAKIVFEGSRKAVESRSVVGILTGKSKETIMVQSHHDSVFNGAVEDGSGVAAVLAQAQHYASQPKESREKTMLFVTFDTHFTGYQSHMAFIDKYIKDKDSPYKIVANITLEHIAKQGIIGADGKLEVRDQSEIRGIMNNMGLPMKAVMMNTIVKHDLRRMALLQANVLCTAGGMPTDASFVCREGIPTASLISGPIYLYDKADTLDKIDRKQLVPITEAFIDIIDAIDLMPSALIGLLPIPIVNPVEI